ncbi:conserved protein [Tepidicaulis marinus]|uniref:Conserved protein n=1 Tax=Tepidicaulis marinus TaxID=1333998 RepID=A0A081BE99_9HYPH|nr:hypothetical protein [Tepidicaulis marinus]GAK46367.1 conserved protein [Tepidicaulis marinus]
MWAIVAVTLHLLAGPDVYVITDAGTFETKEACEAEIAKSVPAKLEGAALEEYKAGSRGYMCIKAIEPK